MLCGKWYSMRAVLPMSACVPACRDSLVKETADYYSRDPAIEADFRWAADAGAIPSGMLAQVCITVVDKDPSILWVQSSFGLMVRWLSLLKHQVRWCLLDITEDAVIQFTVIYSTRACQDHLGQI